MGPVYCVRSIFYCDQAGAFNQFGGFLSRGIERYNAVRVAVNYQRRYIDASQVRAEIFMPGRHACKTRGGRRADGDVPTRLDGFLADSLAQEDVGIEEVLEKLGKERVAIRGDSCLDALEHAGVHAVGVV